MSDSTPSARTLLAAIVFTDAVGFSASAREDEAAALRTIASDHGVMRALCGQFDGRVVKSTGDGLLLMFDSAVSAFQCSLAILRDLADSPLQHRIGVHLGDVTAADDDVMGDGVNVAARLQELARPGEMCASQTVIDVVQSRLKFALRPMGEQTLKNIPQPMRVYAVDPFAAEGRKRAAPVRFSGRIAGFALGTLAVLAVGIPLWMLALRPPAAVVVPRSRGPITLSPELARYLESGTDANTSAPPSTADEQELAAKLADLETLKQWFEKEMEAYPPDKPLTLPASEGAEPATVWADAGKGVVVKQSDAPGPDKVRAFTFVRASQHLLERMPDGAEKVALIKKLESLSVPRKTPKPSGEPGKSPPNALEMAGNLPLSPEFQQRMEGFKRLNATVVDALKEYGPDKPFVLEEAGRQTLTLWFDGDGDLVGRSGDGATAPVQLSTYARVAREVVQKMPPGSKRDDLIKMLDSLKTHRANEAPELSGE